MLRNFLLSPFQVKLGELEAELVEINANNDKLQRSYNELVEYKLVLEKVISFYFTIIIVLVDVTLPYMWSPFLLIWIVTRLTVFWFCKYIYLSGKVDTKATTL